MQHLACMVPTITPIAGQVGRALEVEWGLLSISPELYWEILHTQASTQDSEHDLCMLAVSCNCLP